MIMRLAATTVAAAVLAPALSTGAPIPTGAADEDPRVRSCYDVHGPGLHDIQLTSGRHFLLALPDLLPGGTLVPAVIDWHGFRYRPRQLAAQLPSHP